MWLSNRRAAFFLFKRQLGVKEMTFNEIKRHYNISDEVIQKYKDCGFCRINRENECSDLDLEKLKLILLLLDSGFDIEEIENYIKIQPIDKMGDIKKMKLLDKKRNQILDKIHIYEKQLENLDYIRHEIRKIIDRK